jgi:hypothetical protein
VVEVGECRAMALPHSGSRELIDGLSLLFASLVRSLSLLSPQCLPPTGKSLQSFFTYDTKGGVLSNIAFRLYRLREYKIIFVQVMYLPFCIIILSRGFIAEFIVVKLLLFIWPFLRNCFINYICWAGQPELQVPFETVFLSPFYNYFLILCAIHGRLKCLLWYIPNVPPNHGAPPHLALPLTFSLGMLQRCRPRDLAIVKAKSKRLYQDSITTKNSESSSDTTVMGTVSPLVSLQHNNGIIKPDRFAEASHTDSFEFFYRFPPPPTLLLLLPSLSTHLPQ